MLSNRSVLRRLIGLILWPKPSSRPYQYMSGGNFVVRPNFAEGRSETVGEREEVVVARNAKGYVKGLCIYAIREHATYGRLIDVPFFIASSATAKGWLGSWLSFSEANAINPFALALNSGSWIVKRAPEQDCCEARQRGQLAR